MVTGGNLGGSGTDLAANMSLIHNLLSQKTEALHLLLVNQHFLLPALVTPTTKPVDFNYFIVISSSE